MKFLVDYPLVFLLVSFAVLRYAPWLGKSLLKLRGSLDEDFREDFGVILAATLTMLAMLVGFCFSMAVSRYDQRKNYEEAEANAIGTEYLRADLLPADDAGKVRALLRDYLDQRVLFYTTRDSQQLQKINARTSELQRDLWSALLPTTRMQPTPTVALVVSGMNDVLNSEGYTQAAWWNRIPTSAWLLLMVIAIFSNVMIGFGAREFKNERYLLGIIPLVTAIAFFLIADIDSPRGGIIRVEPQNLERLVESLRAP
jgi:hypothetical protein